MTVRDAPSNTRTQLIESACRLFAAHGYAGASISSIARELGLSKQALLHHFGSKGALYSLTVEQAAAAVLQLLFDAMDDDHSPEDQLEAFFASYQQLLSARPATGQLVLRELLDNALTTHEGRAFVTLLESLVATVQATERWQGAGAAGALGVVTQLIGAASLLPSAEATLNARFGGATVETARSQCAAISAALVSGILRG
ncbi:TetR/AcrR family transcriptional regulator [Tritonibacter mobilis]|uniref:TetR/AcrR family transcriptional regulator n=1 Tax=Tritonibacter mobilis TaxID=379347 RepID=UPI000806A825|nr:TetR/AcrR family transcriptional regulator [Tritonibacter mobilis]